MTFEFLADALPFGYSFNFENHLFNKARHISTQGVEERADFFLVNKVRKRIEAKIHFLLNEQKAYSPYQSLFGSFEFNQRISTGLLSDFCVFITEHLRQRNIREIHITHPAECYSKIKSDKVKNALLNNGFNIALEAVNHHIPVMDQALDKQVHVMEKRKISKCHREGLQVHLEPRDMAEEIYELIQISRKEKNLEPSISIDQLNLYLERFPQDYLLFTVKKEKTIYAATVVVRVNLKVLYNFLPASPQQFNSLSPSTLLYSELYNYGRDHKFEMLDLGISTTKSGHDQEGLIIFKEHMGGQPGFKYSYQRNL